MSAELPAGAPARRTAPADAPPTGGDVPDDDGRVEAIALAGIPEIVAGDDLGALIGDALARAPDVHPLRTDDVLVVTQKVVSKAEGAMVQSLKRTTLADLLRSQEVVTQLAG